MKPFLVLLLAFAASLLLLRALRGQYDFALAGRIAMAIMLCFTAIAHFAFTKGMTLMLPPAIPYKSAIVYATGFMEIGLAIGLLLSPSLVRMSGWLLILLFVLLLPANVYAALRQVDYQKANFKGPRLTYLWFRVPLQLFFITWVYLCSIWQNATHSAMSTLWHPGQP